MNVEEGQSVGLHTILELSDRVVVQATIRVVIAHVQVRRYGRGENCPCDPVRSVRAASTLVGLVYG
ncbi:MAG TPA: hypothetical protein DEQ61_25900 [Streptomyces sp.]|nr:hypothetical protein [Streptomyces sp.]